MPQHGSHDRVKSISINQSLGSLSKPKVLAEVGSGARQSIPYQGQHVPLGVPVQVGGDWAYFALDGENPVRIAKKLNMGLTGKHAAKQLVHWNKGIEGLETLKVGSSLYRGTRLWLDSSFLENFHVARSQVKHEASYDTGESSLLSACTTQVASTSQAATDAKASPVSNKAPSSRSSADLLLWQRLSPRRKRASSSLRWKIGPKVDPKRLKI
ncbi:hypothetical protein CYMTET_33935 [Cymbomonas tetramitiformis]|uniref:Uncharacterized protein n=1 Tax=Cymbomonas tetramitiformis TaxID=36881 RepID=A0AAE0FBZ9_9CHLO|nr:hypothetical protein CYMTET_33935 [Cymbomonas tetramitiformis]